MKKLVAILLCITCLFSIGGCHFDIVDEEQEIYSKTVNDLLAALDAKDTNAIYNLFSVSVQNEDKNLKEKIEGLIAIYDGPKEEIGDISCRASEATQENGYVWKNTYTTFPVLSNGEYYWFCLDLMYENTLDENQIGITQLDFYTADAYYEFWSGEDKQQDNKGLNIFDKKVDEYHIISINNYPYDYCDTEPLNIEEVKLFLETSTSIEAFADKFGKAASRDESAFVYSLPEQDGEERYLYLLCPEGEIIDSDILSNFTYIAEVFEY